MLTIVGTVILWGTEEEMKYQQELEQTELAKRKQHQDEVHCI